MEHKGKNDDSADGEAGAAKIRNQTQNSSPKKRKTNDNEVLYKTMNAGLKPPWALFDTFMREADLMGTYKKYEKEYYEDISFICSRFKDAFADNDIELMVDLYDDLESLKQHHRRNN